MRTILLILTLIFTLSVCGQSNLDELKSLMEAQKITDSVREIIKSYRFETLDIIEVYQELERRIDFGYEHHRFLIIPASGSDLKLNIIAKDGTIMFGWLSEYIPNKEKLLKVTNFKSSAEDLKSYVSKHNEFYQSNLSEKDFEDQILAEYIVGFGCGFGGEQISQESKWSLRYTENNNVKKLREYLTSFSPELQTLGTIGLLKLGSPTEKESQIFQHLKERNSEINSCSGCIYGYGETYNERIKYYEKEANR